MVKSFSNYKVRSQGMLTKVRKITALSSVGWDLEALDGAPLLTIKLN